MNKNMLTLAAAAAMASLLLVLAPPASYAQANPTGATQIAPHTYHGTISSVQLDDKGSPAWIQAGVWALKIKGTGSAVTGYRADLMFRAAFDMVKPDGTAMHRHAISNLNVSSFTNKDNMYAINGTATVTMKGGPVQNVPVAIKIMNDSVIAIWIGPAAVDGHFGTGPVYGTVAMRPAHR